MRDFIPGGEKGLSATEASGLSQGRETIAQSLQRRRERLESELADINAALAGLQEHPEVEKLIDLLSRVR